MEVNGNEGPVQLRLGDHLIIDDGDDPVLIAVGRRGRLGGGSKGEKENGEKKAANAHLKNRYEAGFCEGGTAGASNCSLILIRDLERRP